MISLSVLDFDKKTCTEIPPLLEQYLQQVAKTGKTWYLKLNKNHRFYN